MVFDPSTLALALRLGTATLHESAGRTGAFPAAIKPVTAEMRLAGPAFTVQVPQGDNLWIHRALYAARPGDVLVVSTSGGVEWGYWGDILNAAAMQHGLGGLVIDGGVRDTANLARQDFPVFSNGVCIRGTIKGFDAPARMGLPTRIGDVTVQPGDLIVGDRDGVVAIPAGDIATVLDKALEREADEAGKIARIQAGERTIDIYGFGDGRAT